MRITFVLPMFLAAPAGGFKVVYEYANRLQARGHIITVVHPRNAEPQAGAREFVAAQLWRAKLRWQNRPLIGWFPLHPQVRVALVPDLRERFIPCGDAIVATAFDTAPFVTRYAANRGTKFYLIQHDETWLAAEAMVRATWRLPLYKFVIARWLEAIAHELGEAERTTYLPNGLDFTAFRCLTPPAARSQPSVAMMYHTLPFKGSADGLAALALAREAVPSLRVQLFGVMPRPADLPAWCAYEQQPSPPRLEAIYNENQIFLSPSLSEGWGLPAMEALACGCALVSTDNQGVRDFTRADETALLVPPQQPTQLAAAVVRLLHDEALRLRLAHAGQADVQRFTWDASVNTMEAVMRRAQPTA